MDDDADRRFVAWVLLLAADLVWKLAAGWFAADQGNPPLWLYLLPSAVVVVLLGRFAWRTWLVHRSSGRSTP